MFYLAANKMYEVRKDKCQIQKNGAGVIACQAAQHR